jgi:cbb3-type cytochrome oxidase cytochrome c subunit
MGQGPELTRVGQDPAHTAEWIQAHIRNPKSHKQQSRMPPFGPDKITDEKLKELADYLASLK